MKGKTLVTLTLLSAFLLLTVTGQAQDGGYSNLTFQPKSEGAALRYSLFGTVVPVATGIAILATADNDQLITAGVLLVGSGIMVGPSVGYFYGGRGDRGVTGIAIRLGLYALTGVTAGTVASSSGGSSGSWDNGGGGWDLSGFVVILAAYGVGYTLILIDTIYDVAKVKSTVRKHNEKLQARSLGIVPTYSLDSDAPGLALQLTF